MYFYYFGAKDNLVHGNEIMTHNEDRWGESYIIVLDPRGDTKGAGPSLGKGTYSTWVPREEGAIKHRRFWLKERNDKKANQIIKAYKKERYEYHKKQMEKYEA